MAQTADNRVERNHFGWLMIPSEVPQMAGLIQACLVKPEISLTEIKHLARPYEREFLRWQVTRLYRAPVEITGPVIDVMDHNKLLASTGFEGYKYSQLNPAAIVADIAVEGQRIRETLIHEVGKVGYDRFWTTLRGDYCCDFQVWSKAKTILEGLLARFRATLATSETGQFFREKTDEMLNGYPPIEYEFDAGRFKQSIPIPSYLESREYKSKTVGPTPVYFNPEQRLGYELMTKIGIVGVPIIRGFNQYANNPENADMITFERSLW